MSASLSGRLAQMEKWAIHFVDSTPLRLSLFLWLVMGFLGDHFRAPNNGGLTLDWQFFQFFDEVARKTIADFHQLPIWNPYFCGGTTLIGNPQTTYFVPTFPLVLHFGTTLGERLSTIPVLVIGCEGCFRLLRHLSLSRSAALLGAIAFPFNARLFGWLHDGQYGLPGWAFCMWVLYGYLRGLERPVYLALGAAFFAWMISFRGIETSPQLALGILVLALLLAWPRLRQGAGLQAIGWPILAGAILAALTFGYAGLRMAPVFELVLKHPRIIHENLARSLSNAFVVDYGVRPGWMLWSGYAYVGLVTYLLFVGSVFSATVRSSARIWLLLALVFLLLASGYQGAFSPQVWVHQLPLFRSLRNPALWAFSGALFVVLVASHSLDGLSRWLTSRGRPVLAMLLPPLLVLGNAFDLVALGHRTLSPPNFPFGWAEQPRIEDDFHQTRGNRFEQTLFVYQDHGSLNCYDETPFPTSAALRPDLTAEEYLADPSAGTVQRIRWTPNAIELEAKLTRPATVIINQNWQPGWSSTAGTVHTQNGLVAIDLPPGVHSLRVRIWPPACTVGLVCMFLALLATAWLVWHDRAVAPAAILHATFDSIGASRHRTRDGARHSLKKRCPPQDKG